MAEYIFSTTELFNIDESWLSQHEQIVRCKDCMFFLKGEYCWVWADDKGDEEGYVYVEPDGYCKWGERKDDVEQ